jgi:hypothetical protein
MPVKIACLGWGSLVWDPRTLHVRSAGFHDGPFLPIEFARESSDKRITLVITPGTAHVRSLWALSSLDTVDAAVADLALRENIKTENIPRGIGVWQRDTQEGAGVASDIAEWGLRLNVDAVIWTNLKPRFRGQERIPSIDQVIRHIRDLSYELRSYAEKYVRETPPQIDTPYRRRLEQEFGWTAFHRR